MNLQILIYSLGSALVLSLIAIGFNLIYNTTKVFHLAHGGIYVISVYIFQYFMTCTGGKLTPGIAMTISAIFSMLFVILLIVSIEYTVYRPLYLKKVNPAILLISSLAVYTLIVSTVTLFYGNSGISLNRDYSIAISTHFFKLTSVQVIQGVVSVFLIILIFLFTKSKYYNRIRATSNSYIVAAKFGINVEGTRLLALVIGSVLVNIAGLLKGFEVAIEPNSGLTIILTAAVAVIIGGVRSITGTILACFVISLIENYSVTFLSVQWKDFLTYIILIIILLFYKRGLISVKQRIESR